ncbi:unnamed protein product [Mesocestoides corti]|uniref:SAM-dependent methyltransferase TRM5/TYW2-type domain-containing protein n=1 Tax=Mesocestoides corti TaxID=53468 RepID=A0A0R3UNT5_MESCO|nr:unnamed protein product [Mesocestoides corti]
MSAEAANSKDYSLPPALDLKLDKSVFERKEVVLAVGLPLGRDFKKVWDQLRDFSTGYLDLPKFTNIYTDGNGVKRKLVFIRKAKDTKEQDMLRSLNVDIPASPEDEISYLESHPEAICVENCQPGESTTDSILPSKPCAFRLSLGYENFPFDRALKVVLPGDMEAVTGFSLVGHVAHFNLKPAALPYRRLIGQIALDKLANVRTVVNKAAKIDTDFRTFSLDLMAGEPDYLTEVKENNVTLKLDFSQVYWNSRLGTEHSRIIDEVKTVLGGHRRESELATVVVYDVFAGVGPFAVPLARCPGCRVFANDLNPMAFKFLQENVRKNSSRRHPISPEQITCSNLDGREFIHEGVAVRNKPSTAVWIMMSVENEYIDV